MQRCVPIVRMHLNAQMVIGINNLYQQRKFLSLHAAEQLPVVFPQARQALAVIGSSADNTGSVRIGADDPGLPGVVSRDGIPVEVSHLAAAPENLFKKRIEKNQFAHHSSS